VATSKPRLNITLTSESRAALEKFSEVSGLAASQFVAQIVHDCIPLIESMTHAFELARKSPQAASDAMRDVLNQSMVQAAQHSLAFDKIRPGRKLRKRPTRD